MSCAAWASAQITALVQSTLSSNLKMPPVQSVTEKSLATEYETLEICNEYNWAVHTVAFSTN